MRQIKFRGKILNSDKWVEGDLLQNNGHPIIVAQVKRNYINRISVGEGSHWSIETPAYFVDPATIGQFTGLLDKNGKEIWEGDILQLVDDAGNEIKVVCEFGIHKRKMDTGFWVEIPGFSFISPLGNPTFPIIHNYAGKSDLDIMEIIGSIHDNTSLLTNK